MIEQPHRFLDHIPKRLKRTLLLCAASAQLLQAQSKSVYSELSTTLDTEPISHSLETHLPQSLHERTNVLERAAENINREGSTVVIVKSDAPIKSSRLLFDYSFGLSAYEVSSIEELETLQNNPSLGELYIDIPMQIDGDIDQKTELHIDALDHSVIPQWDDILREIGIPTSRDAAFPDLSNVEICVVDTAFDIDHPALVDNIVAQSCHSAQTDLTDTLCLNGKDTDEDSPNAASDENCDGQCIHGTGVGSMSSLNTNVGLSVAKSASAYGGDAPGFKTSDILASIDWCIRRKLAGHPVVAINLSSSSYSTFEGSCNDEPFAKPYMAAIAAARKAGILFVNSAGNYNMEKEMGIPSCIQDGDNALQDTLIAMGASTWSDKDGLVHIAPFSNRSVNTSAFAVGMNLLVAAPNGQFAMAHGTSFSSPEAALGAAYMLSQRPEMELDTVEDYMRKGSDFITADSETLLNVDFTRSLWKYDIAHGKAIFILLPTVFGGNYKP